MKFTVALFCIGALFSTQAFAQDDPPKKSTEDLVKAAKSAKATRRKSSTKVITNKDVRKAKGKLIQLTPKPEPKKTERPVTIAQHDAKLRQRSDAEGRLEAAQKKADALQKELDTIEQSYYQENDPNYRDNVIQQRFEQTKRQLDDARKDLADARDALQKLTSQ